MDFWIIAALITALVAAPMVVVLLRRRRDASAANDVSIYRDQLAEVDRDLARGVLDEDEADRLRLEVSRRLLEAGRKARSAGRASAGASPVLAGLVVIALFGGTYLIYRQIGAPLYPDMPLDQRISAAEDLRKSRMSQAAAEARLPAGNIAPDGVSPEHLELMDRLRTALKTRPGDLQGHILLARNEAALQNFSAAARAQQRVLELKGAEATAADWADYADMLILAAGGYVSPEAEGAIRRVLELDPQNGVARYYLGLMLAQTGRPDLAFRIWSNLLDQSPSDAPWVEPIRAQIEGLARDAGVRYTLPPAGRGPSQDDIAAAQDMTEAERQEMISAMVEQLAARLADEGGPVGEWARLIGALGVLGQKERAAAIWAESQKKFAASPEALAQLRAAAEGAGLVDAASGGLEGDQSEDPERRAMLRRMAADLARELETNGGAPRLWAQLIALMADSGDSEGAYAWWQKAKTEHAGDDAALALIDDAARGAGLAP